MQLINSYVIRELSTIIFFQELISGSLNLGGFYPWAYISGLTTECLYPGGIYPVGLYLGAYIRGAYNRGHVSGGLITGGLISRAYIPRGL